VTEGVQANIICIDVSIYILHGTWVVEHLEMGSRRCVKKMILKCFFMLFFFFLFVFFIGFIDGDGCFLNMFSDGDGCFLNMISK